MALLPWRRKKPISLNNPTQNDFQGFGNPPHVSQGGTADTPAAFGGNAAPTNPSDQAAILGNSVPQPVSNDPDMHPLGIAPLHDIQHGGNPIGETKPPVMDNSNAPGFLGPPIKQGGDDVAYLGPPVHEGDKSGIPFGQTVSDKHRQDDEHKSDKGLEHEHQFGDAPAATDTSHKPPGTISFPAINLGGEGIVTNSDNKQIHVTSGDTNNSGFSGGVTNPLENKQDSVHNWSTDNPNDIAAGLNPESPSSHQN